MCSNLFINEWIRRVVLSQNCPVETPRASGPHQAPLECGSHLCWTQMEAARLRQSRSEDLEHVASPSRAAPCLTRNCNWLSMRLKTQVFAGRCSVLFHPLHATPRTPSNSDTVCHLTLKASLECVDQDETPSPLSDVKLWFFFSPWRRRPRLLTLRNCEGTFETILRCQRFGQS